MGHRWLLIAPFYISNSNCCMFLPRWWVFSLHLYSVPAGGLPRVREVEENTQRVWNQITRAVWSWSSHFTSPGLWYPMETRPLQQYCYTNPVRNWNAVTSTVLVCCGCSLKVSFWSLSSTLFPRNVTGSWLCPHRLSCPTVNPTPRSTRLHSPSRTIPCWNPKLIHTWEKDFLLSEGKLPT